MSRHSLAGPGKLRPAVLVAGAGQAPPGLLAVLVGVRPCRFALRIPTVATLVIGAIQKIHGTKAMNKSKEVPNFTILKNGLFESCLLKTGSNNGVRF